MALPTIAGVQARICNLTNRPPIMLADAVAEVFGTTAKRLMEQVRRNMDLFPSDFMIELTEAEFKEKSPQIAATSQGKRTDLTHYGFTEAGALMVLNVLRTAEARSAAPIVVRAFLAMREQRSDALRHERFVDKYSYVGRSALRQRIMAAADAGASYNDLWGRWGYSHRVLTGEIEAMRVRGYIGPMVLTPPLYILREIDAKKAHTALHVEDTQQLRLGLEG
jgi:hypothetical protein